MSTIRVLYRLQEVDREWDEKAQRFSEVRERLTDNSEIAARRQEQAKREKQLHEVYAKLQDAELELDGVDEKRKQVEEDLYSGEIASPRRLDDLRQDRDYLQRRTSTLEDRVLSLMTQFDTLQTAVTEGEQTLKALEKSRDEERGTLGEEYKTLHARLRKLRSERQQLRAQVDPQTLSVYDQLRRTKGGRPLAAVQNGICQVCRVTLPSHKLETVRRESDELVLCDGCGRILYQG